MANRSRPIMAGLAAVLALTVVSCGKSEALGGRTGPTPPAPTAVSLEIGAPPRIAPGESVQLTATLVKSDGSREDISNRAGWVVDSPVLAVSQTGVAHGVTPGEAAVTAAFERFAVQAVVFVLPAGTFKLSGVVTGGGFGLGNATLTILSAAAGDLTAKTTRDGRYAIYGVAGRVDVQVRKDGYLNRTATLDVGDHAVLNVALEPDTSTTSGIWTLRLSAGPCASGEWTLPAEARDRTYTAWIVEEWGPRANMDVTLSDADFIGAGNRFTGFRDHELDNVRLTFFAFEDEWGGTVSYPIFERLGPDLGLAITGQLDTLRTSSAIEGRFSGSFLVIRDPPYGPIEARCDSPAHDFEMIRR